MSSPPQSPTSQSVSMPIVPACGAGSPNLTSRSPLTPVCPTGLAPRSQTLKQCWLMGGPWGTRRCGLWLFWGGRQSCGHRDGWAYRPLPGGASSPSISVWVAGPLAKSQCGWASWAAGRKVQGGGELCEDPQRAATWQKLPLLTTLGMESGVTRAWLSLGSGWSLGPGKEVLRVLCSSPHMLGEICSSLGALLGPLPPREPRVTGAALNIVAGSVRHDLIASSSPTTPTSSRLAWRQPVTHPLGWAVGLRCPAVMSCEPGLGGEPPGVLLSLRMAGRRRQPRPSVQMGQSGGRDHSQGGVIWSRRAGGTLQGCPRDGVGVASCAEGGASDVCLCVCVWPVSVCLPGCGVRGTLVLEAAQGLGSQANWTLLGRDEDP